MITPLISEAFINKVIIPTIIDIEASGFGSESYPIEVGVVTYLSQRYCRLIKPQPDWSHWSEEAEQLHGISRALLLEKGVRAAQVCAELNELLIGQTVYSDGWVVDYPWLIKLFYVAQMEMKFTLSPLENILTEQQMEKWHDTQKSVCDNTQIERHRASNDAVMIQSVFMQTQHLSGSSSIQF
ncbi:hypothetical protein [Aliiglaciecola litoralis]|uniref:Exonuclease domain-containing protein n=1 Tax=Aliiglaciecola litoralis TaxID=582857 RepID=A0ABN1LG19_9ALTE